MSIVYVLCSLTHVWRIFVCLEPRGAVSDHLKNVCPTGRLSSCHSAQPATAAAESKSESESGAGRQSATQVRSAPAPLMASTHHSTASHDDQHSAGRLLLRPGSEEEPICPRLTALICQDNHWVCGSIVKWWVEMLRKQSQWPVGEARGNGRSERAVACHGELRVWGDVCQDRQRTCAVTCRQPGRARKLRDHWRSDLGILGVTWSWVRAYNAWSNLIKMPKT